MPDVSPIILISDVHGCWNTLVRLLNCCAAAHPSARLILLGDLIDRGPHSRAVVEFAMRHSIPTLAGNHEDLALAYSPHAKRGFKAHCAGYYDRDVWLYNGGHDTLGNWPITRIAQDGVPVHDGNCIPDDVLAWMQDLPAYLIPDAPPDVNGRRLLASHTGYGLHSHFDTPQGWMVALWGRHGMDAPPFPTDTYYRVFGHTQEKQPRITDTYAMIDTGAAYHKRGLGTLTAFVWPTKEIIQQAYDESPAALAFDVESGGRLVATRAREAA